MAKPHSLLIFCKLIFLAFLGVNSASAQIPGDSPRKGLTFSAESASKNQENLNTASASCGKSSGGDWLCNPYEGDTVCSAALPLLCILDIDAAVPTTIENSKYWSGGVLAKSSPQRGTNISTLKNANDICADSFGKGWRVASFHDGGGWAIEGYGILTGGRQAPEPQRMWVDIKDQPSATCWTW